MRKYQNLTLTIIAARSLRKRLFKRTISLPNSEKAIYQAFIT